MIKQAKNDTQTAPTICNYNDIRPTFERLVDEVKFVLQERLKNTEMKVSTITGRTKTPESLEEKLQRKQYLNPLKDVTDLAGVRIVCYYEPDIQKISALIKSSFVVHDYGDKLDRLGVDKMGYHGVHFIITLGPKFSGARYDGIIDLKCEIQVRTVLQDAWALISHHLIYKDEASIPLRIQRDLNNVASLLEIAQGVFDNVRDKREQYLEEIQKKEDKATDFLSQAIDYDTLGAYTKWKFPGLPVSENWQAQLLRDLNRERYRTLRDIDNIVEQAEQAVEAYKRENPSWFRYGTDYLTKSLGFMDQDFRTKHSFAELTLDAFNRLGHLVKKSKNKTK